MPYASLTSPSPGDFFLASSINDLFFVFDKFSTLNSAPLTQSIPLHVSKSVPRMLVYP